MTHPVVPIFASILLSSGLAFSQSPAQDPVENLDQDPVTAAHQEWNAQTGADWRLNRSTELGGLGRFLWGARATAVFTPADDQDWFELTRIAFDAAYGMFGIADRTLVPVDVQYLALSEIGSSDKVAVEMAQAINGVRVLQGSVHALFTPTGELLALDSNALPGVEQLVVRAGANRWEAVTAARGHFAAVEGMEAAFTGEPELVIVKHAEGKLLQPRLAWSVELRNQTDPGNPAALRVFVSASDRSGEVLSVDELIHHQQIQGHVEAYATPGTSAHRAANPPTIHAMPYMTLTSSAGNATTDANGDFTFNSAVPVTFTGRFLGTYCRVENQAGANHSGSLSFTPGVPATLTLNQGPTEWPTSEASCYDSVNDARFWLKSIRPSDTKLDFQVRANANLNSTCNAYYDGASINMYRSGGGCNNTGFSTVVAHEEGHWANDLYGSGNGGDGFGEGNADVMAMYIYDTPIVGEYFFTNGGFVRTGNNNRQFCGDNNGGCYGGVHADGEVLMGALWKVRERLNVSLGNAAGDLVADTLWVSWMNAYNDGQIRTVVEDHWLALDDNDGNVLNGTPNFGDIDGGFRAQGFPGVDLQLIDIQHTPLGDTQNEAGPYVADAAITSLVGSSITSAELVYSVSGGGAQSIAMSNLGGGNWRANIPGQISPATVSYHLDAHDALGNDERFPRSGELEFIVGVKTQIYFNGFEGATDENWTHAQLATQDDWQRNVPQGKSTDPGAAYGGTKCWGNDLGPSGFNGEYSANVHNYLRSPAIDCSGKDGVRLKFARWLCVEEGVYDDAKIEVNGTVVWQNPVNGDFLDSDWTLMDLDISTWADNNPAVQITFRLQSDGGLQYGGWNIDDFEIYTLDPVPGGGTNTIILTGPTNVPAGSQQNYSVSAAPASSHFWFLNGSNANGTVVQGHAFDVGGNVMILKTGTTTAGGTASVTINVPAGAAGRTGFLEVAVQSGGAFFDSNLLTVSVQ
jgi:hypothetical protein